MAFTINSLASFALCGACAILFRHRNTVTKKPVPRRTKFVRIRKGDTTKDSVYRVVKTHQDRRNRKIKHYKRINGGAIDQPEEQTDEWIATTRKTQREKNGSMISKRKDNAAQVGRRRHKERKSTRDLEDLSSDRHSADRGDPTSAPGHAMSRTSDGVNPSRRFQHAAHPQQLQNYANHVQHDHNIDDLTCSQLNASGQNQSDERKYKKYASQRHSTTTLSNALKTTTGRTLKPSSLIVHQDHVSVRQQCTSRSMRNTHKEGATMDEGFATVSNVVFLEQESAFRQPHMSTCQSQDLIFGTAGREPLREHPTNEVHRSQVPSNDASEGANEVKDGSVGVIRQR
jgi:hypothetical protein